LLVLGYRALDLDTQWGRGNTATNSLACRIEIQMG